MGNINHNLLGVKRRITDSMNSTLTIKNKIDKVYAALKDMAPMKAPGADGFLALLFQKY